MTAHPADTDFDQIAPHTRRELQQDSCTCGGWTTGHHHPACIHSAPWQRSCTECLRELGNDHSPLCPRTGPITLADLHIAKAQK